jgi:hypothetical protein
VTVAVNMRMKWSWMLKDNLWSFHRIMLRELNLKLVSFIGVKSSWNSMHFNDPSVYTNNSTLHHRLSIFEGKTIK